MVSKNNFISGVVPLGRLLGRFWCAKPFYDINMRPKCPQSAPGAANYSKNDPKGRQKCKKLLKQCHPLVTWPSFVEWNFQTTETSKLEPNHWQQASESIKGPADCAKRLQLTIKWNNLINVFPGLLNTIGTLLDRSRVILQKVKKSRKWGPHGPRGDHGPGPQGPWAQQKRKNS